MPRIIVRDEKYYFEDDTVIPPYLVELNEDTMFGNMHRDEPLKDRVGILDDRDEAWWKWYRYDENPDIFNNMMSIAFEVGSLLVRRTAFSELDAEFIAHFGYHDGEEEMLDEAPGDN